MDEAPDISAAEFALDLLEGEQRLAAERRVLSDPGFAREVTQWRERFAAMADKAPEVTPPDGLFDRIEASLQHDGKAPHKPSARIWQVAALVAATVAIICLGLLAYPGLGSHPRETSARATIVAQLAPTGKPTALTAAYDPNKRELTIKRNAPPLAGSEHSEELWVIAGKAQPRSLGVIGKDGLTETVTPAQAALIIRGATLAISLEPSGGSTTGAPTGAIVATGGLTSI